MTASRNNTTKANVAVYGVVCLLLVFVGKINELVPGIQALPLGKMVVGLALLLYFLSPKKDNSLPLLSFPQVRYCLGFVLLSFLSIPLSVWPGHSVQFLTGGFLNSVVFFILILIAIRSFRDLHVVFWGYYWSIAALAIASLMASSMTRIFIGMTYDPNDLALLMVMALPVFLYSLEEVSGFRRVAVLGLIAMILFTIIHTMSRGGFLGLVAVGFVVILKEWKRNTGKIILGGLVVVAFFSFFASDQFVARMDTITSSDEDYNKTAEFGRLAHWRRARILIEENPWIGCGIASSAFAAGQRFSTETKFSWQTSHNSFLQIGVELGVGGILLFVLLLISSIRKLRLIRSRVPPQEEARIALWLSHGLEVGFYGYLVSGFFLSQAYFNPLYFYIALSVVLERILVQQSR